jgi:hypothetical protein
MTCQPARRHSVRVYTARIDYGAPDRLDVTRKSAGPSGLPFAPSWEILGPMLKLRRADGPVGVAYAWPGYMAAYTAEMRGSYRAQRWAWDALLARDEITLVCYCQLADYCHRTVLAEILVRCGATSRGERSRPYPRAPRRTTT